MRHGCWDRRPSVGSGHSIGKDATAAASVGHVLSRTNTLAVSDSRTMTSMPKDWNLCNKDGCTGSKLDPYGLCLSHLGELDLTDYLSKVRNTRTIDARGVELSSQLLNEIFAQVPDNRWAEAAFDEAVFQADARFKSAVFEQKASFYKSVFLAEPHFDGALFGCVANFKGAFFLSERDWISFWQATFLYEAEFDGIDCHGEFHFGQTDVQGNVVLEGAHFRKNAAIEHATFRGEANLRQAHFDAQANFEGSSFAEPPSFDGAIFRSQVQLDGMTVGVAPAVPDQSPSLRSDQVSLDLKNVKFESGVEIALNEGMRLAVESSQFTGPSTIKGPALSTNPGSSHDRSPPNIISLSGSDVGNLVLSHVDLSNCRFDGTHNLDRLRLEHLADLRNPPKKWIAAGGGHSFANAAVGTSSTRNTSGALTGIVH